MQPFRFTYSLLFSFLVLFYSYSLYPMEISQVAYPFLTQDDQVILLDASLINDFYYLLTTENAKTQRGSDYVPTLPYSKDFMEKVKLSKTLIENTAFPSDFSPDELNAYKKIIENEVKYFFISQ